MPIAFDNVSNSTESTTTFTSFSWNHTVNTNDDTILVVGVSSRNSGATTFGVSTITYGGNSCTKIREDEYFNSASKSSALFYLTNPPVGSNSVVVTFEGSIYRANGGAVSLTGVNLAAPIDAHTGVAGSTGTSISTNITTNQDNTFLIDVLTVREPTALSTSSQTERWNFKDTIDAVNGSGSSKTLATAGTTSMDWTASSNDGWSHSICAIAPYVGGGGGAPGTIEYIRTAGVLGATFNMDIGTSGTGRLVTVHIDQEIATSLSVTAVTVDGKSCTLIHDIVNTIGAGNAQQMWYIDETGLGASNGTVTISCTGLAAAAWNQAMLHTGVQGGAPHDSGYDNTSGAVSTITVTGIDCPEKGVVIGGWGQGFSAPGTISSVDAPHTERFINTPTSATLAGTSGIENTATTNKTYILTWTDANQYRATGIIATWGAKEVVSEVNYPQMML